MKLLNMLRGIGGDFEINRVLGAAGVSAYIVTAPGLVAYEVVARGAHFDLVAFCAAFPTGLGVAIGAVAGSVVLKDRGVAAAKQTQAATDAATGAQA